MSSLSSSVYSLVSNCACTIFFFFSSRRRHTRLQGDWSSDVCFPISAEPAARLAVEIYPNAVAVEVRAELDALLPREISADQIAQLLIPTRQADPLVRLQAGPQHHRGIVVCDRGRHLGGAEGHAGGGASGVEIRFV